jgi:hypothetical protein
MSACKFVKNQDFPMTAFAYTRPCVEKFKAKRDQFCKIFYFNSKPKEETTFERLKITILVYIV